MEDSAILISDSSLVKPITFAMSTTSALWKQRTKAARGSVNDRFGDFGDCGDCAGYRVGRLSRCHHANNEMRGILSNN
jgi:hypothetical protein